MLIHLKFTLGLWDVDPPPPPAGDLCPAEAAVSLAGHLKLFSHVYVGLFRNLLLFSIGFCWFMFIHVPTVLLTKLHNI